MTPLWIANNRLLALADIIEAKDIEHKALGLPTYDQHRVTHGGHCRTPACAVGHAHQYMFASGDESEKEFLLGYNLSRPEPFKGCEEWFELFGTEGCGNAGFGVNAARLAAAYIREFVAARVQ